MALSFNLTHSNGEPNTLFSATDQAQEMLLTITNHNQAIISLPRRTGNVIENYHFALCFPPDFITEPDAISISPEDAGQSGKWNFKHGVFAADSSDCYYIQWKGSGEKTLDKNKNRSISFKISGIKIQEGLSSRNVSIVLRHKNIQERGLTLPDEQPAKRNIVVYHLPPVDLSNIGDNPILEILADIGIHPLKAYIDNGWNYFLNGKEQAFDIILAPNEHFFSAHQTSADVKPRFDDSRTRITFTAEDGGTLSINTIDSNNWEIIKSSDGDNTNQIKPANSKARIKPGSLREISLNYTPAESTFGITFIKVNFTGFENVSTELTGFENVSTELTGFENVSTELDFFDFDIHIPLYVGSLRLNSDGHIGIGTNEPEAKLHVVGHGPQGTAAFRGEKWASYINYGASQNTYIRGGKENSRVLINDASGLGNVGIGTNEPEAKLHVVGHGPQGTAAFKGERFISHINFGASQNTYIRGGKENSRVLINDASGLGNVGIGTNKPKAKLHVGGDIYAKGHLFLYASSGDEKSGTAYIQARDINSEGNKTDTNIDLQFRTQKEGSIVDALRIDHNGNVSIGGTTTKDFPLAIQGSFDGHEVEVTVSKSIQQPLPDGTPPFPSTITILDKPQTILKLEAQANVREQVRVGFGSRIEFAANRGHNQDLQTGGFLENIMYKRPETDEDYWAFNFKLRDNDQWKDVMTLESNGNVSIGTKNAPVTLEVNGDIKVTGSGGELKLGNDLFYVYEQTFENIGKFKEKTIDTGLKWDEYVVISKMFKRTKDDANYPQNTIIAIKKDDNLHLEVIENDSVGIEARILFIRKSNMNIIENQF